MWPCSNVIIAILQGAQVSPVLLSFGPCQLLTHIKALSMGAKSSRRDEVYVENMQIIIRKKFHFCTSSLQFYPFVLKISFAWKMGEQGKDNHSLVPFLLLQSPDTEIPFLKLFWLW